jgi:hypothetical protein
MFDFDDSLDEKNDGSQSYLRADYSIEEGDAYKAYAVIMGVAYIAGIPAFSFFLLKANRDEIQMLQRARESLEALPGALRRESVVHGAIISHPRLLADAAARFDTNDMSTHDILTKLVAYLSDEHPFLGGLSPLYRCVQCLMLLPLISF